MKDPDSYRLAGRYREATQALKKVFAPLHAWRNLTRDIGRERDCAWGLRRRFGFVSEARLWGSYKGRPPLVDQISTLLADPTAVFIRFGGLEIDPGDMNGASATMLGLEPFDDADALGRSLEAATLPQLASLHIRLGVAARGVHSIARGLANRSRLPKLRQVEVRAMMAAEHFLEELLRWPIVDGLEHLTLNAWVHDNTIAAFSRVAPRLEAIPRVPLCARKINPEDWDDNQRARCEPLSAISTLEVVYKDDADPVDTELLPPVSSDGALSSGAAQRDPLGARL